jgi:Holliday junction resolvase RusA-like endonuclease
MKPIVIEIPFAPISVNQAFRCFQGRSIKSASYRTFTKNIEKCVPMASCALTEPVEVTIECHLKRCSTSDIDNRIKTILDSLQQRGYIENDKQVVAVHAYKYESKEDRTRIVISLA